jgi:hypothetical protein
VPPPPEPVPLKDRKNPCKKGPTDRSHNSQQSTTPVDFAPSSDEGENVDLDP